MSNGDLPKLFPLNFTLFIMNEKISRNEFLKSLGFKGASLLAIYCGASTLTSCINEAGDPSGGVGVDFTLDLSEAANSSLNTVGNYLIINKVVVARISSDQFAAVTQICSHENKSKVIYQGSEFYCTEHGAKYDLNGVGLNSNGRKGIKAYITELTGTQLRVFA